MERVARRRWRVGVLSLGSNPLRRDVDRMEAGIFAALLVAFLIGAPLLAVAAGWWSTARQRPSSARSSLCTWSPRCYCRMSLTSWRAPARGDAGALARWTAPNGNPRVGLVLDVGGTKAGSRLRIWVDGSGRQADPPLTRRGVQSRVITAAALASVVFAFTLLAMAICLRWLLNRRRLAGWGMAWADIGPRWTRGR